MIKFLTKQFLYGRLYLWAKERLSGIFLGIVIIFLIIYIHSEYLNYVEFKEKSSNSYVGISFIIKNTLILLVALGYFYFYSILLQVEMKILNWLAKSTVFSLSIIKQLFFEPSPLTSFLERLSWLRSRHLTRQSKTANMQSITPKG